jgi:hypothetical protein
MDAVYAVSVKEAARMLDCSPNRVRLLIGTGALATVPDLSTTKRFLIAVAELERFTAQGVTASGTPGRPTLKAAS